MEADLNEKYIEFFRTFPEILDENVNMTLIYLFYFRSYSKENWLQKRSLKPARIFTFPRSINPRPSSGTHPIKIIL